jgi:predicted RNA-binding Zn-ribbon protein involved in translation (DUF1610 family)
MSESVPAKSASGRDLDFPLTDRGFIELFGWISMYFATVDFLVTETILRLVYRDKVDWANALSDRTTLGGKFRLLQRLRPDQVTDPTILREVQDQLPEALAISEMRNRFTHDNWMFDQALIATGRIGKIRLTGLDRWGLTTELTEYRIDELAEFFGRIGEMQQRFASLNSRLPWVIRFECPQCHNGVEERTSAVPAAGTEITCPHCGYRQPIVAASSAART